MSHLNPFQSVSEAEFLIQSEGLGHVTPNLAIWLIHKIVKSIFSDMDSEVLIKLKIFLSKTTGSNALKLVRGLLEHVLMLSCARPFAPGKRWLRECPPISTTDTKTSSSLELSV